MALEKDIPTRFAVAAGYHRIHKIEVFYDEDLVNVLIFSYIDAAARENRAEPITTAQVSLPFSALGEGVVEPTRELIYAALAITPELGGAEDDLEVRRPPPLVLEDNFEEAHGHAA